MCKRVLVLMLVLGLAGSAFGALVHQWSFEGDTTDGSGSGNTGTVTGTESYVTGLPGKGGQAFYFDGSTKVENLNASNLPLANASYPTYGAPFTMVIFFKAEGTCLGKEYLGGYSNYSAGTDADRAMNLGYVDPPSGVGRMEISYNGIYDQSTGRYANPGEWWMIAINHHCDDYEGYGPLWVANVVDGSVNLALVETTKKRLKVPTNQVRCGGGWDEPGSNYFTGVIDEFMIFDHDLTQTDVEAYAQWLVPEPATIALLGLGGLALLRRRR